MKTFVALYRGATVGEAELIAVSANPRVIAYVTRILLDEHEASPDPVIDKLHRGVHSALRVVHKEALEDD